MLLKISHLVFVLVIEDIVQVKEVKDISKLIHFPISEV